jgi:hypothetical protein
MVYNKFDRDKANLELINTVQKIITEELPKIKDKINKQSLSIRTTKITVTILSIAIFIVGIVFLTAALSIGFFSGQGIESWVKILEILGFGSASGLSFISIMLLNPIKKIQESNSNAIQAEMINRCWELGIILYIRAMDINDRESVKEAVLNINDLTINSIDLLEKYYELIPEE